jgi:serine phosphatase RsbU (regulator of sigma subunit)/anti-sigma regulatory factor (Ser/Thr protein kinase)/PAS domain-containing protein
LAEGNEEYGLDDRFRRALDSILDLVVVERAIRDASGEIVDFEILWMNNAPVDVAGRERDRLIGRRISELYPVLAGGELIAGYRAVVETGEPLVVPVMPYVDVIDGREVSGFFAVQATKFEDGVLVASRDITAWETSRSELEVALRELEAAQRLAQLGTWRVDPAAGTVELSDELQRIFGLPAIASGEVARAALTGLIHPMDRKAVADANLRAMKTRRAVVLDHRVVRGDGTLLYVRTYMEPLVVDGDVVGLWGTTQDVSDAIASRDALDVEHVRRVSAEALAELASALNGANNRQDVVDTVFGSAPRLEGFDALVLGVVEQDEPMMRQHFGGSRPPGEIQARHMLSPLRVDTALTRVVHEGAPLFFSNRLAQCAEFPALTADVNAIGMESLAVLPLRRASGPVFGALALMWQARREFDQPTRAKLIDAAAAVARATERLELLDLERAVAQALQLGLLAVDVRSTSALIRARYRPSDATLEIGGDWYDAIELSDHRLAVAVGDVVGSGLPAATTMGQLRAALGVTAMQAADAADAITILDSYAHHVPGAHCATVAFAIIDTERATVSYATAGHPPPLLVTPDGDVTYLEEGRSWPLGVDTPRTRAPAATAPMPAGSLLVLYTDGLIERRGETIDVGLERLRRVVAENWNLPLRRLKEAIFFDLVDNTETVATDDVAVAAVRTVGSSPFLFVDVLHADPAEVPASRRRLRAWLADLGVEGEERDALLVAVGEAVANAIDHGAARDPSQLVRIEIAARDAEIVASISDSGRWQPGIEGFFTGRGRGHLLMQSLADDVDIDTDLQGTIVTLRFSPQTQSPQREFA